MHAGWIVGAILAAAPGALSATPPTLAPTVWFSPEPTFHPTSTPTHTPPTPTPTHSPTVTPTTMEPSGVPTLAPTTELSMLWQRIELLASFLVLIVTYGYHACTKPSELATRGLDPKLYKIREFRVEKLWCCKFCGYPKNAASRPVCLQCGTSQLGEQQIMPAATTRGVAAEVWLVRTKVDAAAAPLYSSSASSGGDYSEGRRALCWDRGEWPFRLRPGGRQSELPTALALAERGFVVAGTSKGGLSDRWGTQRQPPAPSPAELAGRHLEWLAASEGGGGVPVPPKVSHELLTDLDVARGFFFPEKVAWFYEQIHRLQVEAMLEEVPMEFATAYPTSVIRDSIGLLNKVSPLQVLMSRYKIQFVAARSHTRVNTVRGDLEAKWLQLRPSFVQQCIPELLLLTRQYVCLSQALFAQVSDPSSGILSAVDDGSLELNGDTSGELLDANALSFFTGLGRALAMALVSRTFVDAKFSPALCKLLLGRPLHFLDLLHSNQELFQDLLKLMMLPPDAVTRLRLTLPDTSATAAGGDAASWDGRGQKQGTLVTVENRLEYLYRKVEGALFGRAKPQLAAIRRGLFEVIPQELLSVFDHREFTMLLNGHHAGDSDAAAATKVFV